MFSRLQTHTTAIDDSVVPLDDDCALFTGRSSTQHIIELTEHKPLAAIFQSASLSNTLVPKSGSLKGGQQKSALSLMPTPQFRSKWANNSDGNIDPEDDPFDTEEKIVRLFLVYCVLKQWKKYIIT